MVHHWMQAVSKKIEKSGHKGIFKRAAARAGESTSEFTREHLHSNGKIGKRARLAKAFASARH